MRKMLIWNPWYLQGSNGLDPNQVNVERVKEGVGYPLIEVYEDGHNTIRSLHNIIKALIFSEV